MPAASIVAAIIAVAGTITTAVISSKNSDDAQNEARNLADIKRQDDHDWKAKQEELSKLSLKQRDKEFRFQQSEARYGRKERAEERGYQRRERGFDKTMSLINTNQALKGNILGFLKRAA